MYMLLETKNQAYSRRKSKARKRKMQRRRIAILSLTFLFIGAVLIGGGKAFSIYNTVKKYENLIYPGIFIEGVNVGGKTKEQAIDLLSQKYKNQNKARDIVIKTSNNEYKLNFSKLNIEYNFSDVVNSAYLLHKNDKFLKKYDNIKNPKNEDMNLKYKYSTSKIDEFIKNIEEKNNIQASNAEITKSPSGNFIIKGETCGQVVDKEKIKKEIDKNMDIRKKDNIVISSVMKEVKPHINSQDLKKIDTKISTFTTDFASSNNNRATNVDLSTRAINGTILMPGDTFSFNEVVGQRTEEKGYKPATVIVGDKFVDDFGGGVCQVSSTLYNAVTRANILPKERTHHTIASTYVPLGMDATVDFGNIDYKFSNTLPYPIYIEGIIYNRKLTFNIYSNNALTDKKYDLINEIKGNRVNVYKVTCKNGKEIDKQLISSDSYKD